MNSRGPPLLPPPPCVDERRASPRVVPCGAAPRGRRDLVLTARARLRRTRSCTCTASDIASTGRADEWGRPIAEDLAAPAHLCPVDLSKLVAALGASCELVLRHRALLVFCEEHAASEAAIGASAGAPRPESLVRAWGDRWRRSCRQPAGTTAEQQAAARWSHISSRRQSSGGQRGRQWQGGGGGGRRG